MTVSGLPADVEEDRAAFAAEGFSPQIVAGDLMDDVFCRELVAQALARHGLGDFLVNNAFWFLARGVEATPEDFARPVLFLLSDDASFITATDLPVDGGYNGLGPEGRGERTKIAGSR